MKIAVIGATGFVGSNITKELAGRKHQVTGISRYGQSTETENVKSVATDVLNIEDLAKVLKGHDVVVSAYNSGWTNPNIYEDFLKGSKAIQQAVKLADVKRLIVIGGAGSLFINDKQLVDGPDFPADYKAGATAARDYLNVIKGEKELNWTFFSPAIEMHPGIDAGRTGKYRLGSESPVFNAEGRSILSVQDLAVVIADEVEGNKYPQQRFTAAY